MPEITKECSYCGTLHGSDRCPGCNARVWISPRKPDWERGTPYDLGDYIVWPLFCTLTDAVRLVFYDGREVTEVIEISREWMRTKVSEYEDATPVIWDLFCMAHFGETRVYQERRNGRLFECTMRAIPPDEPRSLESWHWPNPVYEDTPA